jgi:hypothetical protein
MMLLSKPSRRSKASVLPSGDQEGLRLAPSCAVTAYYPDVLVAGDETRLFGPLSGGVGMIGQRLPVRRPRGSTIQSRVLGDPRDAAAVSVHNVQVRGRALAAGNERQVAAIRRLSRRRFGYALRPGEIRESLAFGAHDEDVPSWARCEAPV